MRIDRTPGGDDGYGGAVVEHAPSPGIPGTGKDLVRCRRITIEQKRVMPKSRHEGPFDGRAQANRHLPDARLRPGVWCPAHLILLYPWRKELGGKGIQRTWIVAGPTDRRTVPTIPMEREDAPGREGASCRLDIAAVADALRAIVDPGAPS